MATAIAVARHILSLNDPTCGDTISNLKLQKLLYYGQGFHLALTDKPLFREEIQAWQHGPVCPDVYYKFKNYGSGAISLEEAKFLPDEESLTLEEAEIVDEVYDAYGQFSAWALRNRTHEETPWIKHYNPNTLSEEIPQDELKDFFKQYVN